MKLIVQIVFDGLLLSIEDRVYKVELIFDLNSIKKRAWSYKCHIQFDYNFFNY